MPLLLSAKWIISIVERQTKLNVMHFRSISFNPKKLLRMCLCSIFNIKISSVYLFLPQRSVRMTACIIRKSKNQRIVLSFLSLNTFRYAAGS